MRGLPGAGKSTLAAQLTQQVTGDPDPGGGCPCGGISSLRDLNLLWGAHSSFHPPAHGPCCLRAWAVGRLRSCPTAHEAVPTAERGTARALPPAQAAAAGCTSVIHSTDAYFFTPDGQYGKLAVAGCCRTLHSLQQH
jgi:hypothetical protein